MSNNETPWDAEKEAKMLELLKNLAKASSPEVARELEAELQDCTELKIEGGLSHWLTWLLAEHLEIKEFMAILTGKDAAADPCESGPSLLDEKVFMQPEYNWCALEKIKNRDDMLKLRHIYADLEGPIRIELEGAFSFARIADITGEETEYFKNKTLSEAIFDENVELSHLRLLKDYGKLMMISVLPTPTQRSGAIIYASSIAQALVRFDNKITSLSYHDLAESLRNLISRPYIVESYIRLFTAALEKCG